MRQFAEFIAVLSCALFTGAAVYITFIEHPARLQCGVEIAATEFAPSYPTSHQNVAPVRHAVTDASRPNVANVACMMVPGDSSEETQSQPVLLRIPYWLDVRRG
jgi:hypothetical protein